MTFGRERSGPENSSTADADERRVHVSHHAGVAEHQPFEDQFRAALHAKGTCVLPLISVVRRANGAAHIQTVELRQQARDLDCDPVCDTRIVNRTVVLKADGQRWTRDRPACAPSKNRDGGANETNTDSAPHAAIHPQGKRPAPTKRTPLPPVRNPRVCRYHSWRVQRFRRERTWPSVSVL